MPAFESTRVADEEMLRMTQLQHLKHVSLGNCIPHDALSSALLAQLRLFLGTNRLCSYSQFLIRR